MTESPYAAALQPEDYFEIGHATDPQISPDGRHVCYVRYGPDRSTDSHSCTVVVVDVASQTETTIGRGVSPRWCPSSARVAFLRREASAQQIFLWDADSGATSQVTHVTESCEGPAWSPDGASIAFVKRVPLPEAPRIAPRWAALRNQNWAEPGVYSERLVRRVEGMPTDLPAGTYQVFIVNVADGQIAQLTHGPFDHGGPLAHTVKIIRSGRISWTPDGGSIVMSVNREPVAPGPVDPRAAIGCDVHEYVVSTGAVKRLTHFGGVASNATVAPDGRWIAFIGFHDERKAFHTNVLHVMDRHGSEPRALAHPEGLEVHAGLQWLPDSSGLLVLFTRAGRGCVARVSLDGVWTLISDQLGGSVGSGYVLWEKVISVSRQGRLAFAIGREHQADEVGIGSVEGGSVHALTNSNANTLGRRALASVSELWCRSRVDQLKIQCWITRPANFDARRRYPLVLWIHGGPYLSWCGHFALTPQLLAARGYLVLMVNPRGSLGYGEHFTGLIDRQFPGDDHLDLLDAVDAAIELGSVAEDRLYVAGESGGGVLASWMIGKTRRFAAAGIIYPITDWSSMALTVDRPDYYPFYWMGGLPWEPGMHAHYWARSPLSIVGDVETPALLVCGEKDWRTPIAQSEMYFSALKLRGVDAALVRFPDNNHGLEWHPSHSLELIEYLDYWFRRHAPVEGGE